MKPRDWLVLILVDVVAHIAAGTACAGTIPLTDEFSGTSLGTDWTVTGSAASVSGGQLHITNASSFCSVKSAGTYSASDNARFTFTVGDASAEYNWFGLAAADAGAAPYAFVRNYATGGYGNWKFVANDNAGGTYYPSVVHALTAGDTVTFEWSSTNMKASWTTGTTTTVMGETTLSLPSMRIFMMSAIGSSGSALHMDSVSVASMASVPEPSALVLASTGLLGLLACAWRKRKQHRS